MFNSQLVCLFLACVIVLVHSGASINGVDAAFKTARWIRPTADSEQGDRRYLMQKYMKKIVKDAREEDPLPPDGSVSTRRKSRLYHLRYGPIYPDHHDHLINADKFSPLPHQYYY